MSIIDKLFLFLINYFIFNTLCNLEVISLILRATKIKMKIENKLNNLMILQSINPKKYVNLKKNYLICSKGLMIHKASEMTCLLISYLM